MTGHEIKVVGQEGRGPRTQPNFPGWVPGLATKVLHPGKLDEW